MPPTPAQLATIASLAAVFAQVGCGRTIDDAGSPGDEDGATSGGGAVGSGGIGSGGIGSGGIGSGGIGSGGIGSGGSAGTGDELGSGGTGATAPCEDPLEPSTCGEGGCNVGDSYEGGASGGTEGCDYIVETGPTGGCDPNGTMMGPCNTCFCQEHVWLCWRAECP